MKQQPPDGVSASPLGDENLYVWAGTVFGPDDTPWEGGIFSMRLTFTEQYPDKPPRIRFTSEMVRHLRRLPTRGFSRGWGGLAASGAVLAVTGGGRPGLRRCGHLCWGAGRILGHSA
eukprot:4122876-Prymnesium_polylepis.1